LRLKRLTIGIFVALIYTQSIYTKIEVGIGPGFNFSYTRLLPSTTVNTNMPLLTAANEQTAWNLFSTVSGLAHYYIHTLVAASLQIEGGWIRNGTGIIGDANFFNYGGSFSLDNNVTILCNELTVGAELTVTIPHCTRIITPKISTGYFFNKAFESLTFINQPLIFFTRSRYKGPLLKIQFEKELGRVLLAIDYTCIFGKTHIRLTQNTGNVVVFRTVPQSVSTIFTFKLLYKYNEYFTIGEQITYGNMHNHTRGHSTTYLSGVKQPTVYNVDSIEKKKLVFITSLHYDY